MTFRGRNTFGQLGTGADDDLLDGHTDQLVEVDLGGGVVHSIAAGGDHVCARLDDASVKVGTQTRVVRIQLVATWTPHHAFM